MKPWLPAALAAALLIWGGGAVAPARSAAAPAAPAIEWQESAEATWEVNAARFLSDLAPLVDQPARHDRELFARWTALARAIFEKHPEGEGRTALDRKMVADFAAMGGEAGGRMHLRQLVEAFPGRVGLALEALDALLRRAGGTEFEGARGSPDAAEWMEYASGRLIALAQAGAVPEAHPAVERAWKARLAVRMAERRFWDAAGVIAAIRAIFGDSPSLRLQEAELHLAAGRYDDVLRIYQEFGHKPPSESVYSRMKSLSKLSETPPDFPRDLGLEMKWLALVGRAGGTDTAAVQAFLDDSAAGSGVMRHEDGRAASAWELADALLASQGAAAIAPLRASQARECEEALARARPGADPQTLFALYRRFPWSAPVHEALVDAAETWLRRGWSGLALRTFQDVLLHAEGTETRARAQVGLWVATACQPAGGAGAAPVAAALRAAFAGVPADEQLPWMGGRQTASAIQKRLLESAADDGAPAAATAVKLGVELVRLPPVPPWDFSLFFRTPEELLRTFPSPLGSIQACGGMVVVGGPNLLACYGQDLARPLWMRSPLPLDRPRRTRAEEERGGRWSRYAPAPAPGPFVPAVAGGRVFSRWGMDASGQYLRGLVAIDGGSGRILWSTDDDRAWAETWPVSDPAAADGRLYVLTMQEKFGPMMPIALACLDAEDGRLLWQHPLGTHSLAATRVEDRRERPVEPVHYGNAVTVSGGAVYAVTNLGFVARCDARDGMIEWLSPYARAYVSGSHAAAMRRQGASPAVAGGRVVCMPRDYAGVFALDAATGRPAWQVPLAPAEEAVGMAAGALVIKGEGRLVALDPASGSVLWDRAAPEGLSARPVAAGNFVVASTTRRLLRLDAASGEIVEEKPHGAAGPLMALAARDGGIVGLCGSSAAAPAPAPAPAPASGTAPAPGAAAPARAPAPAPAPAGAPPAPGSAAPAPWPALGLPLREAWRLARPNAQLWVPPPEAKSPGLVYLVSRGVLECIEMSPRGGSVWHRFLGPGFRAPLWAEGLLVLAYDDRLAAVRAATGEPLWCCEMPLRAAAWQAAPPYAVIVKAGADYVPGEQLALADLATGRLLWSRPIETGRRSFRFFLAAACGPNIHVFGEASGPAAPRGVEVIVRAADGEVQNVRPFPPGEEERLAAVAVEGATGWCLAGGGSLWEFSVGGSRAPRRVASLEDLNPRLAFTIRTVGPWLQVQQKGSRGTWTERQWILRRDGAGQVLRLDHGGDIWGDALYWSVSRGVGALDLRTGNEMSLEVPPAASAAGFWDVFGCHRAKDRVWVASRLVVGREAAPGGMQLDVFDAATGEHRGSQALTQVLPARGISPFSLRRDGQEREEGPPAAGSEIVWAPDAVYVTDPRGVYALAPAPPGAATDGTAWLVCAAPGPVSIDGHLADWDEGGAFAPAAGRHASASEGRRDAGAGRLYLAHGDGHLYLAVRYATGQKVPRAGSADAGGGSRLEIGLATNKDAYRWSLGSDARGRAAWESLAAGSPVRGPRGAVRYDAAAGELIYEAALPLGDLVTSSTSGGEPQRMGLSAAAWDEAGGTGPVKAVEWGAGLAGRGVSEAGHQPIYLYPLPRRAAAAMQAVVDELPELPESFEHFRRAAATRAESDDALLALYGDFMKRYPRSMTVERLLALDQGLRARGGDPGRRLLEQAEAAGVAPATCRRYAVEAEAHLSQWIFIEHGLQPRGIVLELADGISPGQAGWDHRAAWNKPVLSSARPAYQAQERLPSGQWYEIRVPLAMLNMNGVPLCGISFGQQGGPRVVWDRSAVVYGGREEVFLDDGPPEGARVGGPWEWLDQPVQSGARAHAGEAPPGRYDVTYHWAADFLRPVTAHVQPPEGPYISQWIYLDPSAPPRTASLALHDGRAWRCHAVWGEKTRHGRYMGPLPAAGGWAELRLPIAWTGLASDPVAGLGFGQGPGRLFWGRTALAAGGRETPIVDGSLPPASPRAARGWLPWADGYIGYAWPTSGKAGFGLSLDGSTGYLEVPHTPALEPQELTIEAWILPRTAYSHDPRRWVVNKNTNEEADGHYALMTNKSSVGAYLNIGGTKANMFEAWSDQGALAAGKWSHVAMTYDGKDLKVYANGKCAARTAVNRPRTTGAATALAVGRRQDGYSYFTGVLDEVAVYGRAMTDEEARARYAADGAPPAPDAPGIVLYRGFDEDVMPQDTASGWEWAERPSRGGRPSHTQGAPAAYGGHVCLLREPILGHLPYDTGRAMAVLRREVPNLGATEEAWRLFGRMLQIQPTPEGRVELYRWFIQSLPQHPRAPESLRMLAEGCRQLGRPDAAVAEDVAAAVRSSNLPDETVFAYYRKYGGGARSFVTAWQVIGPFPNPAGQWHDPPLPPETQAVRLDASYDGVKGKVQWKRLESDGGYLDLGRTLDAGEFILAYAACWVRSDRAQPVVIEVSQDDTSKVWVNRQLVINSSPKGGHSSSYTLSATVQLPAGWSEILVKAGNSERNWGFSLEVLDPHGTGPPQGVEFQATPPPPGP